MNKAVFFDKDGTLIPNIPYNTNASLIKFENGAPEAIKKLATHGYMFIVISNQAGVARGFINEQNLAVIGNKLHEMFADIDEELTEFVYCPHDPSGIVSSYAKMCQCRKPLPGMFFNTSKKYNIDLSSSWMIGDILDDIEAGNRAGCRTILIDNGNETEWIEGEYRDPHFTVNSLTEACNIITKNSHKLLDKNELA